MKTTDSNKYSVGLTVSPSSIGYAAVDESLHLIQPKKAHHKNAIGVRKFGEGQTAEDTRLLRAARRNGRRKSGRIKDFNKIMKPLIEKEDPQMFDRIKQSGLSPKDDNKKFKEQIYPSSALLAVYHKKFPTTYHLQKYLSTTDEKADIHLIYEALHTLLINRGHFYNTVPLSQFKPDRVDVVGCLDRLDDLFTIDDLNFNLKNSKKIEDILIDRTLFRAEKINKIKPLMFEQVADKKIAKRNEKTAKEILNAFLGSTVKFNQLFLIEVNKVEAKEWSFRLDDPDLDGKISNISAKLNSNQMMVIDELEKVYSSLMLEDILKGCDNLPDAKILSYKKHKRDLNLYFKFINSIDKEQGRILKEAYDLYINDRRKNYADLRKKWGKNAPNDADTFYKAIKPIVQSVKNTHKDPDDDKSPLKYDSQIRHYADVIVEQIEAKNFLPKQRTTENAYIPYQLNALTFNAILRNQGKYYPELIKPNPCKHDRKEDPYELSQLMQFVIPYYVGPLITPKEEAEHNIPKKDRFAWMVRKAEGKITVWNFYDKVDLIETANQFIKRAIARDTYLLSYPVLPKSSLIYQKYMVYEELSNISINDNKLKPALKQWIYENVFKTHTTVSAKTLKKILVKEHKMDKNIVLSGFTDIKNPKFNSALTTYNSWKKYFSNEIDQPSYQNDLEKIIEWSTVFEDRKIFAEKLKEIDWLSDLQRKFVINQRLTGWGRFSKKLLVDLKDSKGKSILTRLITNRKNFMQIINMMDYQIQIQEITAKVTRNESLDSILDRSYTSPSNRKAIKQSIKVLDDLIKLNNGIAPDKIMLRFQRSESQNKDLVDSKVAYLKKQYSAIESLSKKKPKKGEKKRLPLFNESLSAELKKATAKHRTLTKKECLYFEQLGRDAFTGEIIKFDNLRNYNIVRIIPRSKLTDSSNNNLVLTAKKTVKESAIKEYGNNNIAELKCTVKELWIEWNKLGIISKGKLNTLQTDISTINQYQAKGFVARQLVETNQVAKLLATILQSRYPNTKIIEVRYDQIQDVRAWLNLYRLPVINDFYRAYDAYLCSVIGNFFYNVYPKMRKYFVYGEYTNFKKDDKKQKDEDIRKDIKDFNLLWQLIYGRKDTDYITVSKNKEEKLYNRLELISYMKKVYDFKFIPVSYSVNYMKGAAFKQTLFPRLDRDTAKTRTLIPKKKGYNTEIYGGYTSNYNSYFVLAEVKKKDIVSYKFFGVPVRYLRQLKIAEEKGNYHKELYRIIKDQIGNGTKLKIILDKVPYNQVIEDNNGKIKFYLGSSAYRYNVRELILDSADQKVIMDTIVDPEFTLHFKTKDSFDNLDKKLSKVYEDILYQVKNYLQAMNLNKFVEKLEKGKRKFDKLSNDKKIHVLSQLLVTTKCSPTVGKLSDIGIGALSFAKAGNSISDKAVIIYQSPTGLKENRVPISKLI